MKLELKPFQEEAVAVLLGRVAKARRDAAEGEPQAIVLSSPTASGKTITVAALIERLLLGSEGFSPDPQATFLWVSDSPELNVQSREKILRATDAFPDGKLVLVAPPFNMEHFEPGRVYFLNTQKLGKDSLLTKSGDGRDFTIWDTIENTAKERPSSFFVVIDEAHRGMKEDKTSREAATSLVQRFIKGESSVGLSPVPIVIGMSATPERFEELLRGTTRVARSHQISAADVRASGLIKDRVLVDHPEGKGESDWSLLAAAAARWKEYCTAWAEYCKRESLATTVSPILVVQVEQGRAGVLTGTDLATAVRVMEREAGPFSERALAHSFEGKEDIRIEGRLVRKLEPSKIQDDPEVQVVLFKMALTTGWDCPRAEVMMSFRRAVDHTLIAQLVGRMVRTPLARRVEGDDLLNSVLLYLPHYDREGVKEILKSLRNPDPDSGAGTDAESARERVLLHQAPASADLFKALSRLPTYRVDRVQRTTNTRRLMALSRNLTLRDGIDGKALPTARDIIVSTMASEMSRLKANPTFAEQLSGRREIQIREISVETGEWKEPPGATLRTIAATTENIDDLFERAGRVIGDGIHWEYWRRHSDRDDPDRAKIEVGLLLQDRSAFEAIQKVCEETFERLCSEHREAIDGLSPDRQESYRRLRRQARDPVAENFAPPARTLVAKGVRRWDRHVYVDAEGGFRWDADTWETEVLEAEMKRDSFAGFLRPAPRSDHALCVPYGTGQRKPFYPDLLVLRRERGRIIVDLLDPHATFLADAWEKAVGLAQFAQRHADAFGRIEYIRVTKKGIERLRLHVPAVREKALRITSNRHLEDQLAS